MIITIDGPVATGKSSIAKKLAWSIGCIYYDTGAMYRAVALDMINKGVKIDDHEAMVDLINHFDFRIKVVFGDRKYFLGEENVTEQLRTNQVSKLAAQVSSLAFVREKLVTIQRNFAQGVNAVIFEGRDMGTVVFPDAELKIFLTGRDEVRAQRRYEEIKNKFPDITFENVLADLRERDNFDTTREISPLRKADDAFEIDTSDMDEDEVVFKILECKDVAATRRKREKFK